MKALFSILILSSAGAHAGVVCFNKTVTGTAPLKLEIKTSAGGARVKAIYKDASCRLAQIKYHPVSEKYKGWIRVGTPLDDCPELGQAMFGKSSISHKPTRVYWISLSEEVQKGLHGFVQVGYENDADPGAGPESKLNMGCYPERD